MTTPIPEAAVEVAARAAYESLDTLPGGVGGQTLRESWDSISARLREQYVVSTRAALTAARPLIEAEATPLDALTSELDEWLKGERSTHNQFFGSVDYETAVRLTSESDNARINGLAALIAATIAERTNDEPA